MYKFVKQYSGNLESLLSLVPQLSPSPGGTGYTCTEPRFTHDVYYPFLKDIFPGTWTRCFLAIVWPNGSIMPHYGGGEVIADKSQRYHLVLQTNQDCWSMSANDWQQLQAGGIYAFNPRMVHASINWGKEWRVHFAVDIDQSHLGG